MDFDEMTRAVLVDYLRAHLAWKALPIGPDKVGAKRARDKLHSKVLALAELCERQQKER